MSNFYTDITSDGYKVSSSDDLGYVEFQSPTNGRTKRIYLPAGHNGLYLSAQYVPDLNQHWAGVMSNVDGTKTNPRKAFLICMETEKVTTLTGVCGRVPIKLNTHSFTLADCDDNITEFSYDSSIISKYNDPFRRTERREYKKGFTLRFCEYAGEWVVGGDGTTGGDGIYAYHYGRDRLYQVANVHTPIGWKAQLVDGKLMVAISLPKDKKTYFVHESEFKPAPNSPIQLLPRTLTVGVGMFNDTEQYRIIDTTEPTDTGTVKAVLCGTWDSEEKRSAALARAKKFGVGCLMYKDKFGLKASEVPIGMRALLYAYPAKGESPLSVRKKLRTDIEEMEANGVPYDIAIATYRQWNGKSYDLDMQTVRDTLFEIADLLLDYKPGALWAFAKTRANGNDGVLAFTELTSDVLALREWSLDWRSFPSEGKKATTTTKPPKPPVIDSPQPQPQPIEEQSFFHRAKELPVMKGFLRIDDHFLSVAPEPALTKSVKKGGFLGFGTKTVQVPLHGDDQWPVLPSPNRSGWEQVEVTRVGDSDELYNVKFTASGRFLSINSLVLPETRSVAGPWEEFQGAIQPTGEIFLWRYNERGELLLLEFEEDK